jgi:hypothetical protein
LKFGSDTKAILPFQHAVGRGKLLAMAQTGIVVRGMWAACLLLAGLNHVHLLVQYGLFMGYGG